MSDSKKTIFIDLDEVQLNTELLREQIAGGDDVIDDSLLRPDTLEFLDKYWDKYHFIVFTEGDVSFQQLKIDSTSLKKYYKKDNTLIYPEGTKMEHFADDMRERGGDLFIDDKAYNIDVAIQAGYKAVRVRRGMYKDADTNQNPTAEFGSLAELDLDTL